MNVSETISLLQGSPMSRGCLSRGSRYNGVTSVAIGMKYMANHFLPAHLMGPPLEPRPASSKWPLASAAQTERVRASPVLRREVSHERT